MELGLSLAPANHFKIGVSTTNNVANRIQKQTFATQVHISSFLLLRDGIDSICLQYLSHASFLKTKRSTIK